MPELAGSRTEANLHDALVRECVATVRYLHAAQQADIDGRPDLAATFRSAAGTETGHAFAVLDMLSEFGDPTSPDHADSIEDRVRLAAATERHEATEVYPPCATVARDEGLDEIADWFDSLARAEGELAARFAEADD